MLIVIFWLKKLRGILSVLSLKWVIELKLLSIKIFSLKVILKIGQEKYSLLILFWKLILGFIELKVWMEKT